MCCCFWLHWPSFNCFKSNKWWSINYFVYKYWWSTSWNSKCKPFLGYKKCEVEIIENGRYFWVNRKDLEVESDVAIWAQIFDKCDSEKQKYRQKLTPDAECQQCRVFVRNDLVKRKIKSCRKSSKRFLKFKKKLRLDTDVVTCDEQDIISALHVAFEGEIILTQNCTENKSYEKSRQLMVESHRITIIRTNPDAAEFYMNWLINQIHKHIIELTKKQTKKSLIDDLSKRLLELESKSNYSIKSKCLKWVVKNILPKYKERKTQNQK